MIAITENLLIEPKVGLSTQRRNHNFKTKKKPFRWKNKKGNKKLFYLFPSKKKILSPLQIQKRALRKKYAFEKKDTILPFLRRKARKYIALTKKRTWRQSKRKLKRRKKKNSVILAAKARESRLFFAPEQAGRFMLQQIILRRGKKARAIKEVDDLMITIKKMFRGRNSNFFLTNLLSKYRARIHLRSKRLGSITHKIPVDFYRNKGMRILCRWMGTMPKGGHAKNFYETLFDEIVLLSERKGYTYKKRTDLHAVGVAGIPYLKYIKRQGRK